MSPALYLLLKAHPCSGTTQSPPQNHLLVLRAHSTRVPRISNLSLDLPYNMLSWQRLGTGPPWLAGSHNWSLATEMNNSHLLVSPEVILHPGSSRFNHTAPYLCHPPELGSHSLAQAALELVAMLLPQLPRLGLVAGETHTCVFT